jgi:hypothetical protein
MSNASMGEWDSHATTSYTIHVPPKFSWHSIQLMQEEGTTNIGYQVGRLHHWSNLEEDRHNHNTSMDTTRRTININHRKTKDVGGRQENINAFNFGLIFSFSFSLFSAFVQVYIRVSFSVFYLFSACVIIVYFV